MGLFSQAGRQGSFVQAQFGTDTLHVFYVDNRCPLAGNLGKKLSLVRPEGVLICRTFSGVGGHDRRFAVHFQGELMEFQLDFTPLNQILNNLWFDLTGP